MRRWLAPAALVLLAGCAQRALPLPISIVGLDSMTKVHFDPDPVFLPDGGQDLLFLTSADHSELRVLNLDPNLSPRDFIRAPNPIEPLAIPVLPEPVALAHDTTWDSNGREISGPYVYARAAAGSEISVVTDAPAALVEYCRMELSGTVTAIAARAPPEVVSVIASDNTNSLLYYATWDDTAAHLFEVTMPPPGVLARYLVPGGDHIDCAGDGSDAGVTGTPFKTRRLLDLPGESIVELLVLPGLPHALTADGGPLMLPDGGFFDPTEPGLVVATHLGSSGGRTFHVVLQTDGGLASRALGFPGPVKSLLTVEESLDPNGGTLTAVAWADGGQISLDPGSRVLAALDEGACADYAACSGLLSVDVATGNLSYDGTMDRNGNFQTMLTIGNSNGLITGSTIAAETSVEYPPVGQAITLSQLGMYSDSTGSVFFFNGVTLQPINASILGPDVVRDSSGNPVIALTALDGGTLLIAAGTGPDPSSIDAGIGTANSETIYLLFQGQVPGLTNLPREADGGSGLDLPSGAPQVDLGDWVVFNSTLDADCDGGAGGAPVVSASRSAIEVDGGIPAACPQWTTFTVRAGPAAPFVVGGTVSGFIGRVAPGGTVVELGTPYFHAEPTLANPDGGNPIATPQDQRPAVAFNMLPGSDPAWAQDDAFTFNLVNNYAPMFLQIDARLGAGFQLPGPLAIDPVLQLAYIAYPAANGVIEFAPSAITPNVPNYLNLQPYR